MSKREVAHVIYDTPPTPAPAQDVTARAAEVSDATLARLAMDKTLRKVRRLDLPDGWQWSLAQTLADAGLLRQELPSRDEIAQAICNAEVAARARAEGAVEALRKVALFIPGGNTDECRWWLQDWADRIAAEQSDHQAEDLLREIFTGGEGS